MSFDALGLSADLLRAVAAQGYTQPTPIQSQAVPAVLAGRDVLAGAQTGTGKTAAFTLPMLQRLSAVTPGAGRRRLPRALVLTPTRELAAQVGESVRTYGRHLPLTSIQIFGGVGMNPQIDALRRGVDIVVATPGRLLDHAGQGNVDLSAIEILVLDEADRMLDMGFIHDIRRVLRLLPERRQNLLFSATYSREIEQLANGLLRDPARIEVARRNTAAETVDQLVHPVAQSRKRALLAHLIHDGGWEQVLVFTRTKHGANRLAQQLERDNIGAAAIHGNKSQGARTRALADFKRGAIRVLVATDIAARGLDIDRLPHVVNFELPNVPEDYVHRIGRTGRAGADGTAVSLVSSAERGMLAGIERLLGRRVERRLIDGFDDIESADDAEAAAEPYRARPGLAATAGQAQPGRKHHPRPRGDSRDQAQRGAAPGTDGTVRHRGRGRGRPAAGGNRRSPGR
jgi:ATP-dependent RNA helicase RhlE